MPSHDQLNAPIEPIGRAYDFDLHALRTSGRSEDEIVRVISSIRSEFDCFVIDRLGGAVTGWQPIISAVAECVSGWVEVFGSEAEAIHDAIDQASVKLGRQQALGDGDPMTGWDSKMNDAELAHYISTGGQGECSLKLVMYFAKGQEEDSFFDELRRCLLWRKSR